MATLQVVVTGGNRGIGKAIVLRFVEAGHRVIFTYNTGYEDAMKLQELSPLITACCLDQGDFASVLELKEHIENWRGDKPLDVLVNNAALGSTTVQRYKHHPMSSANGTTASTGGCLPRPTTSEQNGVNEGGSVATGDESKGVEDTNKEKGGAVPLTAMRAWEDEALMRVNALGPLWVTEALLPCMRKDPTDVDARSTVLFIGSIGGGSQSVMPLPAFRLADVMSKAALAYAVKHLAAIHARTEIDIMCVSPGATLTEMFQQSTLDSMKDPEAFIANLPKRRLIQPSDVAESVVWLCTHTSARIFHGAVLDASQGLAVRPGLLSEYQPPT